MEIGFEEILKQITEKNPSELSADEIVFLRARRDYLTGEEKERFGEFLEEENEIIEVEPVKKRGRPKKK